MVRPGQEAPGADDGRFGFGAFAARNQPENFSSEDIGLGDWSRVFRTWAGRLQRGQVHEIIRSVEARPGDKATVPESDLRLDEWASAELKSVAADVHHAHSLLQRESVENCPDQQRGRNFARSMVTSSMPSTCEIMINEV